MNADIKKQLTNAGYVLFRFECYRILKNTDLLYQKKISDGRGIRYFINCWVYEKDGALFTEDTPCFEVQFTMKDGTECNVEPFYKEIQQVEDFFNKMWKNMEFGYYELYH